MDSMIAVLNMSSTVCSSLKFSSCHKKHIRCWAFLVINGMVLSHFRFCWTTVPSSHLGTRTHSLTLRPSRGVSAHTLITGVKTEHSCCHRCWTAVFNHMEGKLITSKLLHFDHCNFQGNLSLPAVIKYRWQVLNVWIVVSFNWASEWV